MGFAQHIIIDHHFRVGAQHRQTMPAAGGGVLLAGAGLVSGHALHIGQGRLAGAPGFMYIGRHHGEAQSELAQ